MQATIDSTLFALALTAKFQKNESGAIEFSVAPGKKYDRIVQKRRNDSQRSVHAFVERSTGQVFKAAGWNRPAPKARFTTVASALSVADPYGSYLYMR